MRLTHVEMIHIVSATLSNECNIVQFVTRYATLVGRMVSPNEREAYISSDIIGSTYRLQYSALLWSVQSQK